MLAVTLLDQGEFARTCRASSSVHSEAGFVFQTGSTAESGAIVKTKHKDGIIFSRRQECRRSKLKLAPHELHMRVIRP